LTVYDFLDTIDCTAFSFFRKPARSTISHPRRGLTGFFSRGAGRAAYRTMAEIERVAAEHGYNTVFMETTRSAIS
jgi:hypothetical protein